MAPRMLATGDAPVVLPAVTQPTATVAEIPSVTQRSPTPTSLADRLAGVQQRDDGALGTIQLVASSSLDLDIPVMKASSSASLLQAALLVLAVPAMIFAGACFFPCVHG